MLAIIVKIHNFYLIITKLGQNDLLTAQAYVKLLGSAIFFASVLTLQNTVNVRISYVSEDKFPEKPLSNVLLFGLKNK